jgi:hypothetical protein
MTDEFTGVRSNQVVLGDHGVAAAFDAVRHLDVEVRKAAVEHRHEVPHLVLRPARLGHRDVLEVDVVGVVREHGLEVAAAEVGDLVKDSLARVLHSSAPP